MVSLCEFILYLCIMQIEHEFLMLGDAALSPHRFVDQCNELFELIARIGIGFHISGKF